MTKESAARYNDGKSPLHYLPLTLVLESLEDSSSALSEEVQTAKRALQAFAQFQQTGDITAISAVLRHMGNLGLWDDCARVLEYGAQKYEAWNWTKGGNWTVPIASGCRHIFRIIYAKESVDSESGLSHLGHIMCNLVFLRIFFYSSPDGNDLPPKNFNMTDYLDNPALFAKYRILCSDIKNETDQQKEDNLLDAILTRRNNKATQIFNELFDERIKSVTEWRN